MTGGTVPPVIISDTKDRPDLIIINRAEKRIDLLELSCSFEKNIENANIIKTKKYLDIKIDLENSGWKAHLVPFEIGSRGQVTKGNKSSISNTLLRNHRNKNQNKIAKDLSKTALL